MYFPNMIRKRNAVRNYDIYIIRSRRLYSCVQQRREARIGGNKRLRRGHRKWFRLRTMGLEWGIGVALNSHSKWFLTSVSSQMMRPTPGKDIFVNEVQGPSLRGGMGWEMSSGTS
jgi:hypothetical protein